MKTSDDPVPFYLDSDDVLDCVEPGNDETTTQEHRVRFDKNGKLENVKEVSSLNSIIFVGL